MLVAALPGTAAAESLSISDNNSSVKFTRDDATSNLGTPSDPVQLARTVEWTVDGRRILAYPPAQRTSSTSATSTSAPMSAPTRFTRKGRCLVM